MTAIKIKKTTGKQKPLADKTIKHLADSIYETLKKEGCEYKDIIGVSSQLLGLVTTSIKDKKTKSKS